MTTAARIAAAVLLVGAPVFAAAYPAILRIPPAVARPPAPIPPALFAHKTHAGFLCNVCHPATFPQALAGFTHDEMSQGRFCGSCHDGQLAFAIKGAPCARCHVATR